MSNNLVSSSFVNIENSSSVRSSKSNDEKESLVQLVFVIDTTATQKPHAENIQKTMDFFLKYLSERINKNRKLEVGLVQFRNYAPYGDYVVLVHELTEIQHMMKKLGNLEYDGGGPAQATITEGLCAATQLFLRSNTPSASSSPSNKLVDERHIVLICNSWPHLLPCMLCSYGDDCFAHAARLPSLGISLSVYSFRYIEEPKQIWLKSNLSDGVALPDDKSSGLSLPARAFNLLQKALAPAPGVDVVMPTTTTRATVSTTAPALSPSPSASVSSAQSNQVRVTEPKSQIQFVNVSGTAQQKLQLPFSSSSSSPLQQPQLQQQTLQAQSYGQHNLLGIGATPAPGVIPTVLSPAHILLKQRKGAVWSGQLRWSSSTSTTEKACSVAAQIYRPPKDERELAIEEWQSTLVVIFIRETESQIKHFISSSAHSYPLVKFVPVVDVNVGQQKSTTFEELVQFLNDNSLVGWVQLVSRVILIVANEKELLGAIVPKPNFSAPMSMTTTSSTSVGVSPPPSQSQTIPHSLTPLSTVPQSVTLASYATTNPFKHGAQLLSSTSTQGSFVINAAKLPPANSENSFTNSFRILNSTPNSNITSVSTSILPPSSLNSSIDYVPDPPQLHHSSVNYNLLSNTSISSTSLPTYSAISPSNNVVPSSVFSNSNTPSTSFIPLHTGISKTLPTDTNLWDNK